MVVDVDVFANDVFPLAGPCCWLMFFGRVRCCDSSAVAPAGVLAIAIDIVALLRFY